MVASAGVGVFSMITALLVVPFILAVVSAAQYGIWLVLTATALLMYYSDFGVGSAIIHFSSRKRGGGDRHSLDELLSAGLLWNFFAALLVVPLYALFAWSYLSRHASASGISQGSQTVFLTCGSIIMSAVLLRPFGSALVGGGFLPIERRNQGLAVGFRLTGTLAVCWLFPSIEMIVLVETIAYIAPPILSAANIFLLRVNVRWRRSSFTVMKYMLGYSSKAFVYSLIESILLQGGTIAAGILATPADATYFNLAFRVFSSVRQLQRWITEPLRPAMSRLYSIGKHQAEYVLSALSRVLFLGTTIGCVALILVGPALIDIWVGREAPVATVAATSAVLLVSLILSTIHLPLSMAAYSAGRPAALLAPQVIWLCSFVALVAPFEKLFGIQGIALALTAPLLLVEPMCIYLAGRAFGLNVSKWLMLDIAPSVYLVLSGVSGAALFLAIAPSTTSNYMHSFLSLGAFLLGISLAAVLRPQTIPWNSLRVIFRTEL